MDDGFGTTDRPDLDDESQAEYVRGKVIVAMVRLENIVGFALAAFFARDDRQRTLEAGLCFGLARRTPRFRALAWRTKPVPDLPQEFGRLPAAFRSGTAHAALQFTKRNLS